MKTPTLVAWQRFCQAAADGTLPLNQPLTRLQITESLSLNIWNLDSLAMSLAINRAPYRLKVTGRTATITPSH